MSDRATRKTWLEYVSFVLTTAISVEKGKLACIDTATGLVVNGATSLTLIPIGYFDETIANAAAGQEVTIKLFVGVWVHWLDNDAGGTPVVAADLLGPCYILDETTVTGDATGASVAGRVWALDTVEGVGVEINGMNAG